MKKGLLRNFAKFIGKHLCQSLFFNKIAGFRHEILQNFLEHLFYRTPLDDCFCKEYLKLLPFIDAPVHTIASQYHCTNIIMESTEFLNPGQIAVDVCIIQCTHLPRKYNIEIQKNSDQVNISV